MDKGVAIGDVDNDGDADVYVTNYSDDVFLPKQRRWDVCFTGGGTFKRSMGNLCDLWGL